MQERFRPFEPDTDNAGVGSFFVIIGHIQILGMSFLLLKFAANRQHKLKYTQCAGTTFIHGGVFTCRAHEGYEMWTISEISGTLMLKEWEG